MTDKLSAECACKDPNPIIDGRKANVNLAYMGAKPRIPATELMLAYCKHQRLDSLLIIRLMCSRHFFI